MGSAEASVADGALTVDELAARTGMTVRTVRFYASEGLLPPPERRGRVAYYDSRHRMRLELIRTLQDHGYTLAAVDRVLARIPADAGPAEYAVQAAVLAPWLPDGEQRQVLDRAALDRRAGQRCTDEDLTFLTRLGAIEPVGDERYRVSTSMLGQAVELMQLPVSRLVLTESAAIIDEHATAVANGLSDLFVRAIWGPYQRGELTHEQVVSLLERMRPMALQGLVNSFGRAADHAARHRLERPADS